MKTQIEGRDAEWSAEVWKLWREKVATDEYVEHLKECAVSISSANYYTPRPYVDEYNRGSDKEGFLWVIGREVWFIKWPGVKC